MQEFLVLGNVPGTSLQITFTAWLSLVLLLCLAALVILRSPHIVTNMYRHIANVRAEKVLRFLQQHNLL
ncbi:hypothetical protein KDA14_01210 [Candidatus Saccharibacteria bacterium]|nr:hypothetical protein [Candidatus Saccharibacteria bacterium]